MRVAMEEKQLEKVLARDYSVGTEAFRESLLARCLDVLGKGAEPQVVSDDDLEMLAAAGVFEKSFDDED